MRKLLNALFVTTPDAWLAKDGENVIIKKQESELFRIPVHNIENIVCFGYQGASPALMAMCAERQVGLSFVTEHGRFLCRVSGKVNGNVLLRRKQYRLADDEEACCNIARVYLSGKLANGRNVLQRAMRDHGQNINLVSVEEAVVTLNHKLKAIQRPATLDMLRGMEGEAAAAYFGVFDHLILHQKDAFYFHDRNRRPPIDNVNAMLSFTYVLLSHEVQSALETVGLDPYVGFLHRDRPGRASLALDLMEEFRPYLADRLVLSLINRKQVGCNDFVKTETGAILMKDGTRKTLLESWQKRKQETVVHPFLEEEIPVGLLPYAQALLFARFLRGDLENYPVFIAK